MAITNELLTKGTIVSQGRGARHRTQDLTGGKPSSLFKELLVKGLELGECVLAGVETLRQSL